MNINQFAGGLCLISTAIVVTGYNTKWIVNSANGPAPISMAELRKVEDPKTLENRWIEVTGDYIETEYGIYDSEEGDSKILLVPVGDKWLMAELPDDHEGQKVSGYLGPWTSDLHRNVIRMVEREYPEQCKNQLPYKMDGKSDRLTPCGQFLGVMLFVSGIIVFGYGTWWGKKPDAEIDAFEQPE